MKRLDAALQHSRSTQLTPISARIQDGRTLLQRFGHRVSDGTHAGHVAHIDVNPEPNVALASVEWLRAGLNLIERQVLAGGQVR